MSDAEQLASTPAVEGPGGFRLPALLVAVAPYLDPRTWGAVAYLWLGFPLGLLWFIGMTVGFLTGAALTLIWVGLVILAATLLAVWAAEGVERQLAILLLGARVPERRRRPAGDESIGAWARSVLGSESLWKGTLFLALRFPLGLAGWLFSVVSLAISFAFLAAPWIELLGGEIDFDLGWFYVEPRVGVWFLFPLGYLGLLVSLHAQRGLGWLWARLAEWLLGERETANAAPATPVGEVPATA